MRSDAALLASARESDEELGLCFFHWRPKRGLPGISALENILLVNFCFYDG